MRCGIKVPYIKGIGSMISTNILVDGEELALWIENNRLTVVLCSDVLYMDVSITPSDIVDLGFKHRSIEVKQVDWDQVKITPESILNTIRDMDNTDSVIYDVKVLDYNYVLVDDEEIFMMGDEFVAIIYNRMYDNAACRKYVCVINDNSKINDVIQLSIHKPQLIYVNNSIVFNDALGLDENIINLKEQLMEELSTKIEQHFDGKMLIAHVMAYGGRSKFQRKKRINLTKERLNSALTALNRGKGITDDLNYGNEYFVTNVAVYNTINRLLPEPESWLVPPVPISASTPTNDVITYITEILKYIDRIKDYRF